MAQVLQGARGLPARSACNASAGSAAFYNGKILYAWSSKLILNFLSSQSDFKEAIQRWREQYGEIVGVQLGSELAVFLSDYELINT